MKKILCLLLVVIFLSNAFADDPLDKTTVAATASYVEGAFNSLDTAKQNLLTNSNVSATGSNNAGAVVTAVTASNGTVTVTKSDLAIPIKNNGTVTGTATFWLE